MSGGPPEHIRSIPTDIILTLITCGLFNLVVQHKQMLAVNEMMGEDKYHFVPWLLLTIVTCGLYHIYHEYRMAEDIADCSDRAASSDSLIALVLSVVGLSIVVDAIQQSNINSYYGSDDL